MVINLFIKYLPYNNLGENRMMSTTNKGTVDMSTFQLCVENN